MTKLGKRLGALIRRRRIQAHLFQHQLADCAEVSRGALSQYEAGRNVPSLRVLLCLAQHLDLGLEDFTRSLSEIFE